MKKIDPALLKANKHARYMKYKAARHASGVTSNGKPWNPRPILTFEQALIKATSRFKSKIRNGPRCHIWQGGLNRQGYGKIKIGKKTIAAHRVAFMYEYGPIPNGRFVCHTCDNPPCVNVDHLWLGDAASNMADKIKKGRQTSGDAMRAALVGKLNPRKGSQCHIARLTEAQIPKIMAMRKRGLFLNVIAKKFGVCTQSILNIVNRKTWKHVK